MISMRVGIARNWALERNGKTHCDGARGSGEEKSEEGLCGEYVLSSDRNVLRRLLGRQRGWLRANKRAKSAKRGGEGLLMRLICSGAVSGGSPTVKRYAHHVAPTLTSLFWSIRTGGKNGLGDLNMKASDVRWDGEERTPTDTESLGTAQTRSLEQRATKHETRVAGRDGRDGGGPGLE